MLCGGGEFAVKSSILDKEPMNRVVSLLLEAEAATAVEESPNSSGLRIIDGFIIPKFRYDPVKKVFYEYVKSLTQTLCLFLSKIITI